MYRHKLVNIITLLATAANFWPFVLGFWSAANAFFVASVIIILYISRQLTIREDGDVYESACEIFTDPSSYPRNVSYYAFVVSFLTNVCIIIMCIFA